MTVQGPYQPTGVPAPYVVNRKEPALSGVLSFLIPGVGQFYNGQTGAGVGFLVTWLLLLGFNAVGWVLTAVFVGIAMLAVGLPLALGLEIWAVIHAVLGAQKANQRLIAGTAHHG